MLQGTTMEGPGNKASSKGKLCAARDNNGRVWEQG